MFFMQSICLLQSICFFLLLFVISIHLMYYFTFINSTLLVYKIKRAHWVLVRCLQRGCSVALRRGCSGHWCNGGDGGSCLSVACDMASGGVGHGRGAGHMAGVRDTWQGCAHMQYAK